MAYPVQLTEDQIDQLADAAYRRIKQLKKSIERDTGTYHNALDRKCVDLRHLQEGMTALRIVAKQINDERIDRIRNEMVR